MKPLTILLGIVMGSSVALGVSLGLTAIVFLLLGDVATHFRSEGGPLLRGILWSWLAVALSAAAFYGEVRQRSWRYWPLGGILALLLAAGLVFWPR